MGETKTKKAIGHFHGIEAEIIYHGVSGVPANALIIKLPQSRNMLSSRDGYKTVKAVCNCYLPESLWPAFESDSDTWPGYLKEVLGEVALSPAETAALSTGVNMDYLAWHEEAFEELWVLAFVTAGVSTNAMRIGMDKASTVERTGRFTNTMRNGGDKASAIERNGIFDKVGTINTVVFTGSKLDLTPMAASFITITEAKNIALQEMKVKSCYNPQWQATGTGTDQIVMVSGKGDKCIYVGGHTKLGEMIAVAVTSATVQAIKNSLKVAA